MPPQASSRAAAMRNRSNLWTAGGTNEASWAQYSTIRRGALSAARSASARG
jgi:hypothetical protein